MVDHELSYEASELPVSCLPKAEQTGTAWTGESADLGGSKRPERTAEASAEVLGIDVTFECRRCGVNLIVDFRLQGRLTVCPVCDRMIEIPKGAAANIQVAVSVRSSAPSPTRLSAEELA